MRSSSLELSNVDLVATSNAVHMKWAGYPGNDHSKLNQACLLKLKEPYDNGKVNKKQMVGTERAH